MRKFKQNKQKFKELILYVCEKSVTDPKDQETIPYETVFISDDQITPFEIARGKELAAKYGRPV